MHNYIGNLNTGLIFPTDPVSNMLRLSNFKMVFICFLSCLLVLGRVLATETALSGCSVTESAQDIFSAESSDMIYGDTPTCSEACMSTRDAWEALTRKAESSDADKTHTQPLEVPSFQDVVENVEVLFPHEERSPKTPPHEDLHRADPDLEPNSVKTFQSLNLPTNIMTVSTIWTTLMVDLPAGDPDLTEMVTRTTVLTTIVRISTIEPSATVIQSSTIEPSTTTADHTEMVTITTILTAIIQFSTTEPSTTTNDDWTFQTILPIRETVTVTVTSSEPTVTVTSSEPSSTTDSPPSPSTTTATPPADRLSLSTGQAVGVAVGVVVLLLIVVILALLCRRAPVPNATTITVGAPAPAPAPPPEGRCRASGQSHAPEYHELDKM
ncbi:hypothetical protein QQX98_000292 [Neonectria punicea]|uniref:Uncharacterized protein n=1 Tax=Neonectria punicea TaxID=979145 RepID=A0ABR1HV50_9HYPO